MASKPKKPRGPTLKMKPGQRLTIEVVDANGAPVEPKEHFTKFVSQCGVVARDNITITCQEWNKLKKARVGFTYVDDKTKNLCFDKLMEHFVLPPEYNEKDEEGNVIPGGLARRNKVKEWAIKKMGEAFKGYKKRLNEQFVSKNKTPEWRGQYEKLQDLWPEFEAQKKSEFARAISAKNKLNASKKIHHHIMGSAGYRKSIPKWELMEMELMKRNITPGTAGWDPRAKYWWYGHGGKLCPETGGVCTRTKCSSPPKPLLTQ